MTDDSNPDDPTAEGPTGGRAATDLPVDRRTLLETGVGGAALALAGCSGFPNPGLGHTVEDVHGEPVPDATVDAYGITDRDGDPQAIHLGEETTDGFGVFTVPSPSEADDRLDWETFDAAVVYASYDGPADSTWAGAAVVEPDVASGGSMTVTLTGRRLHTGTAEASGTPVAEVDVWHRLHPGDGDLVDHAIVTECRALGGRTLGAGLLSLQVPEDVNVEYPPDNDFPVRWSGFAEADPPEDGSAVDAVADELPAEDSPYLAVGPEEFAALDEEALAEIVRAVAEEKNRGFAALGVLLLFVGGGWKVALVALVVGTVASVVQNAMTDFDNQLPPGMAESALVHNLDEAGVDRLAADLEWYDLLESGWHYPTYAAAQEVPLLPRNRPHKYAVRGLIDASDEGLVPPFTEDTDSVVIELVVETRGDWTTPLEEPPADDGDDEVPVLQPPEFEEPEAAIEIRGDEPFAVGETLTLDASESSVDSELSVDGYEWTITPAGGAPTRASGATVAFEPSRAVDHEVAVTVTDVLNRSASASTTVGILESDRVEVSGRLVRPAESDEVDHYSVKAGHVSFSARDPDEAFHFELDRAGRFAGEVSAGRWYRVSYRNSPVVPGPGPALADEDAPRVFMLGYVTPEGSRELPTVELPPVYPVTVRVVDENGNPVTEGQGEVGHPVRAPYSEQHVEEYGGGFETHEGAHYLAGERYENYDFPREGYRDPQPYDDGPETVGNTPVRRASSIDDEGYLLFEEVSASGQSRELRMAGTTRIYFSPARDDWSWVDFVVDVTSPTTVTITAGEDPDWTVE